MSPFVDDGPGISRSDREPVSPERIAAREECERMYDNGIKALAALYVPGTVCHDVALLKMVDKAEEDVMKAWCAMARGEKTAADFRKAFAIYYKLQRVAIGKCVAKGAAT